jgi:hypothetical protein
LQNVKVVAPPPLESEGIEIARLEGGCPPTPCSAIVSLDSKMAILVQ